MLLMKISAIIIEIVALVAPYDTITTISHHFIPENLADWRYNTYNYVFIKAMHDYISKIHCVVYYIIISWGIFNNILDN